MKKFGLLVLLATGSILAAKVYNYQDLRLDIVQHTFLNQKGLMRLDTYQKFISPFIDEMEQKSKVLQYFIQNEDTDLGNLALRFKYVFAYYNFFCFRNYVKPASGFQKIIDECEEQLLPAILTEIKKSGFYKDFDEYQELAILKNIIERACKQYYNNLSSWHKILVGLV